MTSTALRAGRLLGAPLALTLAAAAVSLVPGLAASLEYDRHRIAAGELWRVLTCHWTHWSADHLLLDAVVLLALGIACSLHCGRRWLGCVAVSSVLIPAAVWVALPEMVAYRGLSGIDAALYVLLAVSMLRQDLQAGRGAAAWLPATAVIGLAVKIGYELVAGQAAFVDSVSAGFIPVPLAHAVGGAVGAIFGMLPRLRRNRAPAAAALSPTPRPAPWAR